MAARISPTSFVIPMRDFSLIERVNGHFQGPSKDRIITYLDQPSIPDFSETTSESLDAKYRLPIKLLYLTEIFYTDKSILTDPQKQTLLKEKKISWINRVGLRYGLPLLTGIAFGSAFTTYIQATDLATSDQWRLTSFVMGSLSALITGVSFILTGNLPDATSDAANKRQDLMVTLEEDYNDLGKALLSLHHENPMLAKEIADKIPLDDLHSTALTDGLNENEYKRVFKEFLSCLEYIKSNGEKIPYDKPDLMLHINQFSQRRQEAFV